MSDAVIYLPVSLGEAIDKLTILDIKLTRISDYRAADVKREYDLLYDTLKPYVEQYGSLYTSMKKVNILIWEFMDDLRDGELEGDAYLTLCKKTIDFNDIRFRIKNKINSASGSFLKEQKGYKVNSVLITGEISDVDHIVMPIRYYSYLYDQVIIHSNNDQLKARFQEDPAIVFVDTPEHTYKHVFTLSNQQSKEDILNIFNVDEKTMAMLL